MMALLVLPAAGCFGGDEWRVEAPHEGDFFSYSGTDGSVLNVTIEGVGVRRDGSLVEHDSVLLRFDLRVANASHPVWTFREAVDVATGRIVQQSSDCGLWTIVGDDPISCHDDRHYLIFGAASFPGAMGSGALWGRSAGESEPVEVKMPRTFDGDTTGIAYTLEPMGPDCRVVIGEGFPDRLPRALPWTALSGPFTVCPGIPLPVTFVTGVPMTMKLSEEGLVTYTLMDWTRGVGGPLLSVVRPGEATQPLPVVPLVNLSRPFYIGAPADPFPFSTEEAHAVALERVDAYRDLFAGGEGTVLHKSLFATAGWSRDPTLNTLNSMRYGRTLQAVAADGATVHVRVEKTVYDGLLAGLQENPRYEIDWVETGVAAPFPSPGSIVARQADVTEAVRFVEGATGLSVATAGFTHLPVGHGWMGGVNDPLSPMLRPDGYEVVVHLHDPAAQAEGGLMVSFPYMARVEGPTGRVILMHMPAERMPF